MDKQTNRTQAKRSELNVPLYPPATADNHDDEVINAASIKVSTFGHKVVTDILTRFT